ncbi:MAG TPA: hypothetical protein VGH79_07370 [Gaiellaceae bacterium]|jgi:hypothetical protein
MPGQAHVDDDRVGTQRVEKFERFLAGRRRARDLEPGRGGDLRQRVAERLAVIHK